MSTVMTRRSFLKSASAGVALSVAGPWSAPWAYAGTSGLVRQYDAAVPNAYTEVALGLISSTPGFTPPVASRALAYMGAALYESLAPGMVGYRSLHRVFPEFPPTPTTPRSGFHWPTVANHALAGILRSLFPPTSPRIGEVTALEESLDRKFAVPAPIRNRSVDRGAAIAQMVDGWAMGDGGNAGHLNNFPSDYVPPVGAGLWTPTPPAFQPIPLQPFWGHNRSFTNLGFEVPPPPPYSEDPSSEFYRFGLEVYDTSSSLTPEQEAVALFWADDPGTVTPPGHSVSVLRQVLSTEAASLEKAAESYLRVGCAIADAFILCWREKYIWNLLRPVTYIRANIDPDWSSLVPTPPFPEYSSGHSTQSGAWAEVMTSMFGNGYRFTDHTHDNSGLDPRSFASFSDAAEEAAVSRLYGGIHYSFGNESGLWSGTRIGRATADLGLRD